MRPDASYGRSGIRAASDAGRHHADVPMLAMALFGGINIWLVRLANRRDWVVEGFAGAAVLGLVVCAYASAVAPHGNGFIAAFIGGLAFASMAARRAARAVRRGDGGALVSLLVWLAFGAVAVAPMFDHLTWQLVVRLRHTRPGRSFLLPVRQARTTS